MKKIMAVILLITFLNIPSLSFAESGDTFIAIEGESGISDDAINGRFSVVEDSDASGMAAMKSYNAFPDSQIQLPEEKPLEYKVNIEEEGRYKIFFRIKGQDSVNYSVNGEEYKRTWFTYSEEEYTWILLTENDFKKGENSIVFSARKMPFYIDKLIITNSLLYYPLEYGQDLSESSGITEIFDKPSFYPQKGEHPRVILNSARANEIVKNLKHEENAAVYNNVLSALSYTNDGNLDKTKENNEDRKALDRAEANAFMYLMTGLDKYADTAVSVITNYLSSMKYPLGTLEDMRNRGGVIFKASLIYDWCHKSAVFTKEKKDKIVELILKQAGYLECGWPPVNLSAYDSGHGWENSIIKDLFAFSIAVYDEYPEIYECVAGRIFSEFIPVANYHYKNGDFYNRAGDDYGLYRYEFELYLTLLLKGMGAENYINENQKNVAYQAILRLRPDNTHFRIGDIWTYGEKNPPEAYHLMLLASYIYKEPHFKQFFFDRFPNPGHIWNSVTGLSPMLYLVLNDTGVGRRSRTELPLSSFSGGDSGVLTARTSWEQGKNSEAMLVSVHMPKKFYGGHQHLDAGSFEVYYKGPLAIDSGIYNSEPWTDENGNPVTNLKYGSEHDNNYHKRTIAHNSMLVYKEGETNFGIGTVNDGGQKVTAWYPHNMTLDEYTDPSLEISDIISYSTEDSSYTYIRGDLTGWYSSEKVDKYERSFLFYNFSDNKYPGALIVFDKLSSKDAGYKKTWLLHSQQKPVVSENITTIRRNENGYNGRLVNETLLPLKTNIEIIGGDGKEYFVDGKNYTAIPPYEPADESGNYRVEISPSEDNTEDYFLNVMHVSDDDDNIIPLNSDLYKDENFYGVKINNRLALFSKSDGKISKDFIIDANTYGNLEYTICGVSAGSWKIVSANEAFIKEVTKEEGVLSFNANGEEITITKLSDEFSIRSDDFYSNINTKASPYLDTYPLYYKNPITTAVVSPYLLNNGYSVREYGFMYSKNKNSDINDDGVIRFPANSSASLNGGFGISLIDYTNKLKGNYYLKSYVSYMDNGEQKYAYGKEIFIEGKTTQLRMPISWTASMADKAYSIDPTIDVTAPSEEKILRDVAVYTSIVASELPGNQYKSSMAFIRIDVSKFNALNLNKPVIYNIYGALGSDNPEMNTATVELYEVDNDIWSLLESDNISHGVGVATNIDKIIYGETPVAAHHVEKLGGYWVGAELAKHYPFDITESIKKCVNRNETYLTLAIRLKNETNKGNSTMRFRIWQTSTSTSDITYYQFNE